MGIGRATVLLSSFGSLIDRERLHEVRLPAENLRRARRGLGRNEDDAIELRAAAIVRRVGDELDSRARVPLHEAESSRADWVSRQLSDV